MRKRLKSFGGPSSTIYSLPRLVTCGPYALVRHPSYLGEIVAIAVVALQHLSGWAAGFGRWRSFWSLRVSSGPFDRKPTQKRATPTQRLQQVVSVRVSVKPAPSAWSSWRWRRSLWRKLRSLSPKRQRRMRFWSWFNEAPNDIRDRTGGRPRKWRVGNATIAPGGINQCKNSGELKDIKNVSAEVITEPIQNHVYQHPKTFTC